MKTMRITERTIERINKVTEDLINEARGIINEEAKPENCMNIDKDTCNEIIKNTMEAIDKLINDYNLTHAKVNVWNKSESRPENVDKEFIEVLHDYYGDSYFEIKKKTRCDQLINRIYRLVDEVKVLIGNANRTAEMEGVEDTNESSRGEEKMKAKEMRTEIYTIKIEETNEVIEIHVEHREGEVNYYIADEGGAHRMFTYGITNEEYEEFDKNDIDGTIDYIVNEFYDVFCGEREAIEKYYFEEINNKYM